MAMVILQFYSLLPTKQIPGKMVMIFFVVVALCSGITDVTTTLKLVI